MQLVYVQHSLVLIFEVFHLQQESIYYSPVPIFEANCLQLVSFKHCLAPIFEVLSLQSESLSAQQFLVTPQLKRMNFRNWLNSRFVAPEPKLLALV